MTTGQLAQLTLVACKHSSKQREWFYEEAWTLGLQKSFTNSVGCAAAWRNCSKTRNHVFAMCDWGQVKYLKTSWTKYLFLWAWLETYFLFSSDGIDFMFIPKSDHPHHPQHKTIASKVSRVVACVSTNAELYATSKALLERRAPQGSDKFDAFWKRTWRVNEPMICIVQPNGPYWLFAVFVFQLLKMQTLY